MIKIFRVVLLFFSFDCFYFPKKWAPVRPCSAVIIIIHPQFLLKSFWHFFLLHNNSPNQSGTQWLSLGKICFIKTSLRLLNRAVCCLRLILTSADRRRRCEPENHVKSTWVLSSAERLVVQSQQFCVLCQSGTNSTNSCVSMCFLHFKGKLC